MNKGFAQILTSGPYASIQDIGRRGFEQYGVPSSGYLLSSSISSEVRNAIEFFGVGLSVRFSHSALIRVMGNQVSIQKDSKTYHHVSILSVQAGAILKVVSNSGNIGYLTVEGGWKSEKIMSSHSQMKGVTSTDRLYPKMVIPYEVDKMEAEVVIQNRQTDDVLKDIFIVKPGPEFIIHNCKVKEMRLILSSESNRQAICFENAIEGHFSEITSSFIPVGTIQVTKGGKVFVLSKDGQTTGGYFRWGFINLNDLEQLYKTKIGKTITFRIDT